jgi:cobalt/nickel transport system permease protein
MMIGHLTIAGLAEMVLSAGVIAYLQRAEPALLKNTAPASIKAAATAQGWRATKPLWIALAVLLVMTPLGILAAGSAWSEWSPQDFSSEHGRQEIAAVSGNEAPPLEAPAGMTRLSAFWTAPMPRYAPPFLKSAGFGYMLSAFAGTGAILLVILFTGWLFERRLRLLERQ